MTASGSSPPNGGLRPDLRVIAGMIEPGTRLLDVGCGDGELLAGLVHEKNVDGRGIEISQSGVRAGVSRGLSIIQGDAETDLVDFPDQAFDYVVLSQTLQAMHHPRKVLAELLRIGRYAIVSLPNFGHWRVRLYLLFNGRMPVTRTLVQPWYETENIHLCSITDFVALCRDLGIDVIRSEYLDGDGRIHDIHGSGRIANLFGEQGIFLLARNGSQ